MTVLAVARRRNGAVAKLRAWAQASRELAKYADQIADRVEGRALDELEVDLDLVRHVLSVANARTRQAVAELERYLRAEGELTAKGGQRASA